MLPGKKGWIGVDVGTHSIKCAQIERKGRQFRVSAAAIVDRKVDIDNSSWLRAQPISSAREFQTALSSSTFSGRNSACVSPISICDMRTIGVEGQTHKERRDLIGQQLSSIHGVPAENLVFDYWESTGSQSNQFHVLCMADRWTNQIIDDYRQTRLNFKVLDGLPHSLVRAARMSGLVDSDLPLALIDWGRNSATFCVAVNHQPVYVRSLSDCGFAKLEDRVSHALELDSVQTRNALAQIGVSSITRGDDSEMQQVLDDILSSQIAEMEEELLRTIAYLKNQKGRIDIQQGVIFGAGATLRNVAAWLGTKLGLQLKVWSLPVRENESRMRKELPIELFGPAIALSSLAWEAA